MSTRIHPKNVHENSPTWTNSSRQKFPRECVKSDHENSPKFAIFVHYNSSILYLQSFSCLGLNFSLFSITGFSWFGYEFKSKSPCQKKKMNTVFSQNVSRILTRKAANEQRLYNYASVKPLLSLYSQRMLLKQYLIPKKRQNSTQN